MESDEIYKFIGYTVAVIFFIYLISKAFSLNVRVIEGMTSSSDNKSEIKNNNDNNKEKSKKMEDSSNSIKQKLINEKDQYKNVLSAAYNHQLYSIIELSAQIASNQDTSSVKMPDQLSIEAFKNIKAMKDYLDVLELSYDQLNELK